jgi:hypothetical protein
MNNFLYCLLLFQLLLSCGTKEKHDHAHPGAPTVSLNQGEPWEANRETTEGINQMIGLITEFQLQSDEDYPTLKADLVSEFDTILQKCTMKGEAHNQLHHYLEPLKQELDRLSDENLDNVLSYLNTYPKYFR